MSAILECGDESKADADSSAEAANANDPGDAAAAGGAPPKARLLYPADELPPSIDWRTHMGGGWLSPVRNQLGGGASCGSCYAFSTLAMVEARIRIATNGQQNDTLSVLDVVSCSPYSQGCDGGFPYLVGKYLHDYGVVSEECFPYEGQSKPTEGARPGRSPSCRSGWRCCSPLAWWGRWRRRRRSLPRSTGAC